jgi:cation diffusion facilitator CzcD-associated flavoprotein CzcO
MPGSVIEADYVVIGAGAAGMAFTDTLLHHGTSTVAIIDAGHGPGGHWNASYPFVTLHLPSHHYGVESRVLGNNSKQPLIATISRMTFVSQFHRRELPLTGWGRS